MDDIKPILSTPEILEHCLVDETPTPTTRLIRNCEEFGLFEDLKHVNPFEETFRQAIDEKITRPSVLLSTQKSLEVIKCNDEDTLHTPHIFSYNNNDVTNDTDNKDDIPKCETKIEHELNIDKQSFVIPVIVSNESTVSISDNDNDDDDDDKNNLICSKLKVNQHKKQLKHSLIQQNHDKSTVNKLFRKIYPKPMIITNSNKLTNPIKEKIRESLLRLRTLRNDDYLNVKMTIPDFPISSSDESDIKDIPKHEIKRNVIIKRSNNNQTNNSINVRNREAAKRYRYKQKILHDTLQERNTQLETENAMLKKQLQLFKKTHAYCSVSLQNKT